MDVREKFLGAMTGCALGDAIGEIAFRGFDEAGLEAAIASADRLVYTDDTAMAIGLADALVESGDIDETALGERFRRNIRREPWRGYGSGPPRIFAAVEAEAVAYGEAARRLFHGTGSLGNGAAMRIAPLGLFFRDDPELYAKACASAAVTHAHPVGKGGAAVQAIAVAEASLRDPGEDFPSADFCRRLANSALTPEIRAKMERVGQLVADGAPPEEAADEIGQSVLVHESMPLAIYAFLRHPRSFCRCVFCAVLNGGDRDTLGAMAGSVSGAFLGVDAIPATWRGKLENRAYIEELATRLAERAPA
jgi:poly(ADP-ribose) glycohydrolase ARH3